MSTPNYKPSEGKREEFRKYLEKTGVMDALTKVLVSLYEEADKPENAIEYICNKLSDQICGETLDSLRTQLDEMRAKIKELEDQQQSADIVQESEGGEVAVAAAEHDGAVADEAVA